MITELFSADLFEYQDIFASHLTMMVYVYASLAMLMLNAGVVLALSRQTEKPAPLRLLHRVI